MLHRVWMGWSREVDVESTGGYPITMFGTQAVSSEQTRVIDGTTAMCL